MILPICTGFWNPGMSSLIPSDADSVTRMTFVYLKTSFVLWLLIFMELMAGLCDGLRTWAQGYEYTEYMYAIVLWVYLIVIMTWMLNSPRMNLMSLLLSPCTWAESSIHVFGKYLVKCQIGYPNRCFHWFVSIIKWDLLPDPDFKCLVWIHAVKIPLSPQKPVVSLPEVRLQKDDMKDRVVSSEHIEVVLKLWLLRSTPIGLEVEPIGSYQGGSSFW